MFEHYQKLFGLGEYTKSLETHSSHLYWCIYRNQKSVLKIFKPDSDEAVSNKLILAYKGIGAVRVLNHSSGAILLEQLGVGRELLEVENIKATQIYCGLVKKLHTNRHQDLGLKPVIELATGFEGFIVRDITQQALFLKAKTLYMALATSQTKPTNLHGDLHHYNIIQANNGNWLCIDPKGYWGEIEYEIGAFLRNPLNVDLTAEVLQQRLNVIDTELKLDMKRVKNWAFCQAVLAAIWSQDDGLFYKHMLNVAIQIETTLEG